MKIVQTRGVSFIDQSFSHFGSVAKRMRSDRFLCNDIRVDFLYDDVGKLLKYYNNSPQFNWRTRWS